MPLLLLTVAREVSNYHAAVDRAQEHTLETVRALRFALDRELDGHIQSLRALALSRWLEIEDMAGFRQQAERFLDLQPSGSSIILSDASGQQLINSNLSAGAALPRRGSLEPVERIFTTGKPFVSGLFTAAGTGRPTLGVEVPVFQGDRIVYDLTLALPLRLFQDLIRNQALPANWTVSVFDQHNVHIVRQPEPERFVGAGPGDELRGLMTAGNEGSGKAVTLAGVPAFTAFSRSEISSWSVVISVPRAVLQSELQWSLAWTVLAWMLLAAVGAFIASRLSRRITVPIRRLVDQAYVLGRGDMPSHLASGLPEVDRVAEALVDSVGALRESQERLRLAQQAGRVGLWDLDLATDRMWWSDSMYRLCGLEPRDHDLSLGEVRGLIHPDDRKTASEIGQAAVNEQQPFEVEVRVMCKDGITRWLVSRGEIVRNADNQPVRFIGISMDVTDRRQAQEHQSLLLQEVDHRAKNALAVVQALVRLTPSDDPKRFAAAIEGRLAALARAHTLLAESRWSGVSLRELLEQELAPYTGTAGSSDRRVTLKGPEVKVTPDAAQPISMMAHELATNAAKNGALSRIEGTLEVSWGFVNSGRELEVHWHEAGGPPILTPPTRRGFGSTLLKASARQLGGEVNMDWRVTGLRCCWRLPTDRFIPTGAAQEPANITSDDTSPKGGLKGIRVLAVEDDALVSLALVEDLEAMGCKVLAVHSLAEAMQLAGTGNFDAAVLDVNLNGEMIFPAAEILARRGVPFLFATAYGKMTTDGLWEQVPVLKKPYSRNEMKRILASLVEH